MDRQDRSAHLPLPRGRAMPASAKTFGKVAAAPRVFLEGNYRLWNEESERERVEYL